MTQARTLLAATDFSAPARHALERAAQLAEAHPGTRLALAHIVSGSVLDALRRMLPGDAAKKIWTSWPPIWPRTTRVKLIPCWRREPRLSLSSISSRHVRSICW